MSHPWVDFTRVIIPIEAIAGMVLNLVLIFYLVRANIGQAARTYYVSCIITAILSFNSSLGILLTIDLPTMVDGKIIAIFYGPLLFNFPKWVNDCICVAFFAQVHTLWQMIPAPCILQWIALSKREIGSFSKIALAYAIPLIFYISTWIQMPGFLPTDEFRMQMAKSVFKIHGTNLSDFHVFGIPVSDENHYDAIDLALFDLTPSVLVSYALFTLSAIKIRARLHALGVTTSKRTVQMQRRFFLTQIAQVFLPLVLMSIPLGLLVRSTILREDLQSFPFLIGFMLWPSPMFTALLLLGFVRKAVITRTPPHSKLSLSKGKSSTSVAPVRTF